MQPTYEELFAQFQILSQQLKDALAEIQVVKSEIRELKEKLDTNSSNSSKPPSQDPLKAGAVHKDCMNKTKATCVDFFNRFDICGFSFTRKAWSLRTTWQKGGSDMV